MSLEFGTTVVATLLLMGLIWLRTAPVAANARDIRDLDRRLSDVEREFKRFHPDANIRSP